MEIAEIKNELYNQPPKQRNTEKNASFRKTKKQKDGNPNAEQKKFMKPVQDCKVPVSETTEPQKIFMVAPNGLR